MPEQKYGRSRLWSHYARTRITEEATSDLTGFKSSGVNYKLALWDPQTNGVRYLKALIYTLASNLSEHKWSLLRRIGNRDVGNPIAVRYRGELVCMDSLQAVHELAFIANRVRLDGATVLEIGAGYGRTCHAILSNRDVREYYIVDLANSLELSRRYLRAVLDSDRFARVRFVPVHAVDDLVSAKVFDVCLNVDSFAEMDAGTVEQYLHAIDGSCRNFYVNNPVGKYLDKTLDGHAQGDELVALALSTGLLRDVIDIHDSEKVEAQVPKFIDSYRPGPGWTCVADAQTIPWSYYWQALYTRTSG